MLKNILRLSPLLLLSLLVSCATVTPVAVTCPKPSPSQQPALEVQPPTVEADLATILQGPPSSAPDKQTPK